MIQTTRIYIGISLFLIAATLVLHLVAMTQNHWKIYEHRTKPNNTLFIGVFRRCELNSVSRPSSISRTHYICDDNKYNFNNQNCTQLDGSNLANGNLLDNAQNMCNLNSNPYSCDYSAIGKGLISCTIIAACTLGISLLLIFTHTLINQYKYKIHWYIALITLPLLFLGFLFMLIALILLGSTIRSDLYQYRYNMDCRSDRISKEENENFRKNITATAKSEYDVRLEWAGGLEIAAVILSSFTIAVQIIYLISTHRNRIG